MFSFHNMYSESTKWFTKFPLTLKKSRTLYSASPYIFSLPRSSRPPDKEVHLVDQMTNQSFMLSQILWDFLRSNPNGLDERAVAKLFSRKTFRFLVQHEILIPQDKVWNRTHIKRLEIETTTHCNWRCQYCPVSKDPKPAKVMPLELFKSIIAKAERHPSVTHVTLHSYSEISLDPLLEERVKIIAQTRLKLDLYSNASALTRKKQEMLKSMGCVAKIVFNLPSLDQAEHERLTGAKTFQQSLAHIETALELGFEVAFSVNRDTRDPEGLALKAIRERFGHRIQTSIEYWQTSDRAGELKNQYAQEIFVSEPQLSGCFMASFQLHIGIDGKLFVCCEDYYQKDTFGNIEDGEIAEILSSEKAIQLKKYIFGKDEAPSDFICRKCTTMKENSQFSRLKSYV